MCTHLQWAWLLGPGRSTAASRGSITAIIIKKERETKRERKRTRKSARGREIDTETQIEIIVPPHRTTEGKSQLMHSRGDIYTGAITPTFVSDEEDIERAGHYGSRSADVKSGPYSHTDGSNAEREKREIRNKGKMKREWLNRHLSVSRDRSIAHKTTFY